MKRELTGFELKVVFLFYKWIKRECPHICRLCPYHKTQQLNCMYDIVNRHVYHK